MAFPKIYTLTDETNKKLERLVVVPKAGNWQFFHRMGTKLIEETNTDYNDSSAAIFDDPKVGYTYLTTSSMSEIEYKLDFKEDVDQEEIDALIKRIKSGK